MHLVVRAQFVFYSIPAEMKLIPRDSDNIGRFTLSGKCFDPAKKYVRVLLQNIEKDTYPFNQTVLLDEESKFNVKLGIPAEFSEYKLIIYSMDLNGNQTLEKEVKGLVAGDYYIVEGQSNAAGSSGYDSSGFRFDSTYANKYCRSLGTLFERAEYLNWNLDLDCRYYKPSCIYFENGCVAAWPYRLMYELTRKTGIPLCFINSAKGGSGISYHMPSNIPSDPNKLQVKYDTAKGETMKPYDRTFYKLLSNDVLKGVKGIIWYQGETDGNLSYEVAMNYTEQFGKLREAWKSDYPNLKNIFAFQLNTGCAGNYQAQIRDQQRQWPEIFNDVIVMPSVGSGPDEKNEDGCHYTLKGCENLAGLMYPVILKKIYGFNYTDAEIMGPAIKKVSYLSPSRICLEFDKDIDAQLSADFTHQTKATAYLKDYFYRDNYIKIGVKEITVDGTKLFIDLQDTLEKINHLTYLPNIYSEVQTVYMGPWIVNKNNARLGALSFFQFPVKRLDPPRISDTSSREQRYIHLWPSPADAYVQLDILGMNVKEIRLLDMNGKIVFQKELSSSDTKFHVNTAVFQSGMYTMMLIQHEGIRAIKLLIQHE